jgi:competence protein ComEC
MHKISLVKNNNPAIKSFQLGELQVMIADEEFSFKPLEPKQLIDLLILSKNPKLYISNLTKTFNIKQAVIDGSVPQWKAVLWKKDCDSLKIPCYNVSEKGAFVMNW